MAGADLAARHEHSGRCGPCGWVIAIPVAAATGHPVASRTAPAVPPPPIPGLTINVTDGRVVATPGERLTYTLSVRDSGIAAARHLKITQTLSPGLQFLSVGTAFY